MIADWGRKIKVAIFVVTLLSFGFSNIVHAQSESVLPNVYAQDIITTEQEQHRIAGTASVMVIEGPTPTPSATPAPVVIATPTPNANGGGGSGNGGFVETR